MFEPFSSAVKIALERTIRETIEKFEPRVIVLDISVDDAEDSNELVINIIFTLKNTDFPITITTSISRVR
jgi:predicted component of type VI protein secretion system